MFSQHQRITNKFLKHLQERYCSQGSLVFKNNSKNSLVHLTPCGKSKKNDDEPESIWLNNLNLENLKLYRRTSFGSYRKINSQNFLEKLKVILSNQNEDKKLSSDSDTDKPELIKKKEILYSSRHMSKFLIDNMVTFPLVKSNENLNGFITNEEELDVINVMRYPSVTRILQETMSPESRKRLELWKMKMIDKMGPEKFEEYKEDTLNQGAKFHGALKKYLESGEEKLVSIDQSIEGCWNSVASVLEDISNVVIVEGFVHHPVLSYKGYVDCVASYRDVPYVIEWKKTAKKVRNISKLYEAPLQACAYLGALSWRKDLALTAPKKCLLVVAYSDGEPADVFPLDLNDCEIYWKEYLFRLQSFWSSHWSDLKQNESQV